MIQSMTGYGCSEEVCGDVAYRAEVRSVNHRYCDINVRLPESLTRLEQKIRSHISKKFSRGKFDVYLTQMGMSFKNGGQVLNVEAITRYRTMLKDLSGHFNVNFNIREEIGISDMLALKEMVVFREMKIRYSERVKEISGAQQLDMNRLALEIAVMVERMDITEEIVRRS